MAPQPHRLSNEQLQARVDAYRLYGSQRLAAEALGVGKSAFGDSMILARDLGMLGPHHPEILEAAAAGGIEDPRNLSHFWKITKDEQGNGYSLFVKNPKTPEDKASAMRAAFDAFMEELPRAAPAPVPSLAQADLLSQYTITDLHLGALAWNEETGSGDYDLGIGEKLVLDWFSAAIAQAPPSGRAVFAQLGDFLHYDSFKSITPEHGHLLDGDTRYPKMVRAAIRIVRKVIGQLLEKHETVEVIMCDANHDPSGGVWLREMMAAFYEDEPRLVINTNPGTYSVVEHGLVSLFYHHGHRRGPKNVDSVFAGKYREVFGRTKFSYAHTGHKHADELRSTNLMKVEQHETLAAPDAYAANGGWLSGRSAKVITYHATFGEVGRITLTPAMVTHS